MRTVLMMSNPAVFEEPRLIPWRPLTMGEISTEDLRWALRSYPRSKRVPMWQAELELRLTDKEYAAQRAARYNDQPE